MKPFRFEPVLQESEAHLILTALDYYGFPAALDLSSKLAERLARQLQYWQELQAEEAAEERARLARAELATLTPRQAEALAAVRAGKNVGQRWEIRYAGTPSASAGFFRFGRSMGGAIRRMITGLQAEGLLTSQNKLTEPGAARLTRWEAENPGKAPWVQKGES